MLIAAGLSDSNSTVLGILIVALIAPVTLEIVRSRTRRREKAEDRAREDLVAERAAEAARQLLETNERIAANSEMANVKLDEVHDLVNSNLTATMQDVLDSTIRERVMMQEVIELKRAVGREPSKDALAAVQSTQDKIDVLSDKIAERIRQSQTIQVQTADIHVSQGTVTQDGPLDTDEPTGEPE